MTLTINVPDEVAAQVSSLSEADRRAFDETMECAASEAIDAFYEYDEEALAEIVAAGLEAIEDAKAGRLLTLEDVDSHVEAALLAATLRRETATSSIIS